MEIRDCKKCSNDKTKDCMLAIMFPWLEIEEMNLTGGIMDCHFYKERVDNTPKE